jgi:hypothetical protein
MVLQPRTLMRLSTPLWYTQYLLTLRVISLVSNRVPEIHGAVSTTATVVRTLCKCTTHIQNHLQFFIRVHGGPILSNLLLENHNNIHIHCQHL